MLRALILLVLIAVGILGPANASEWHINDADRIVAIADVHGAFDAMIETLQEAEVVDDKLAWMAGETHLIIVGDILDRGPSSRDAMDLLMRLESEALAAGGSVQVLIGNHESMNLIGDLRYVSKAEYAAFAADETRAERDRWFNAYADRYGDTEAAGPLREKFDANYPAGYFALRREFRPDGKYGRWLLTKPVIAVVNGTAFVHGGLSPTIEKLGLDGVNRTLKNELLDYVNALQVLTDAEVLLPTDSHYDTPRLLNAYLPALGDSAEVLSAIDTARRLGVSDLFDVDGPLWYRGNVACGRLIEEHRLNAALEAIGADRVVVGHTPTPNRKVLQRFDGRIIEIDTGMLNFYYKGRGHALVLEGDAVKVVNQLGGSQTVPIPHPRSVGERPGMMAAEQLQDLLEQGQILSTKKEPNGRTIVEVSNGTNSVQAIFTKRPSRGFYPGVAAYRVDRMLELDMVPVTVVRKVDGDSGSLQFWAKKHSDEARRSSSGQGGGASCSLSDQWDAMYVFDVLIYNEGRTLQRMLYDTRTWNLMLSEHDRAFTSRKGRPKHLVQVSLNISDGWKQALKRLNDEMLTENLSDVLDKRRLKALMSRRNQLLAEAAAR